MSDSTSQKRRGRPVDPNSALTKARALYASLPAGSSRQDVIAKFQTITNDKGVAVSKGTAAAYYSVITRKASAS